MAQTAVARAQDAQDARRACDEYVGTCRAAAREDAYERVEPLAWQRLRDQLARAGVELPEAPA